MCVSRHLGHAVVAHICDAAARGQQLACSAVCNVVHGYEKGLRGLSFSALPNRSRIQPAPGFLRGSRAAQPVLL